MFHLESSIAQWRQQMLAAGLEASALQELEGHLREEIERQMKSGMDQPSAFEFAARQIGHATTLKNEFGKIRQPLGDWLRQLREVFFGFRENPFPSPDRFNSAMLQVLQVAPGEARHLNHDFIGTEHVLLGLFQSPPGIFSKVMTRLGLREEVVRREIEKVVGRGTSSVAPGNIPFTPRAARALGLAVREARGFSQPTAGPEHVFLGLLIEGRGIAALVLKNLGLNADQVRKEILCELNAG
jgi:hypothetical protein